MNSTNSDWRLTGQDQYLKGTSLWLRAFKIKAGKDDWDHEHCEFCWQKIVTREKIKEYEAEVISDAYTNENEMRWICPKCFEDFKEQFEWKLQPKQD